MASSNNDGRSLNITLVDISGNEITKGTRHGLCKTHELFQAAYKSKPGFLCKLLHDGKELSPQRDLNSLCEDLNLLTVVWMCGTVSSSRVHGAFTALKSDGSVITWGDAALGGDSSLVEHRLQRGVVQVVGNRAAF
ncbi:unnamed protein product, partial [Polarella glacialis]